MKTVATITGRLLLILMVWWAFTEGDLSGIGFGLGVAILVTAVSMRLFPQGSARIRPVQLCLFVLFFLGRSVVAGIDVARRVLSPSLPVDPGYFTVHLSLPEGSPRWLLANALSLMPGTLSVSLDGPRLELHCLDTHSSIEEDVRTTERRVARVFGLPLQGETGFSEGVS